MSLPGKQGCVLTIRNGDLNIFGNFIPFASPIDPEYSGCVQAGFEYSAAQKRMSKSCFEKVKAKFVEEDVGLVVRLNEKLYVTAESDILTTATTVQNS